MSRRSSSVKRTPVTGDSRYGDVTVTKFINYMMRDGKKSIAEDIFYSCMDLIEKRSGQPGYDTFQEAMANVRPTLEVRSRRVGGVTYQVPVEVRPERMQALAIRWIVGYARSRKGRSMAERLADELMDAQKGQGGSIKKRDDTRKMAEANKAFSHYRW